MIQGEIKTDQVVVHDKTKGEYIVAGVGHMKSAPSNPDVMLEGWTPSVVYYKPGEDNVLYTRDEVNFRKGFTHIEEVA